MNAYEPREDSELLKKYVKKFAFGKVLDMGTGSGIQAIEASKKKKADSVLAVDVDEEVVKELKNKIKKLRIKKDFIGKIKVKQSDLFSEMKGRFEAIIFNPPYLPQDKGVSDKALYGGKKGDEVLQRFLDSVSDYLHNEGIVLIVFSSLTNKEKVDLVIEMNLLEFKELEKKHIFFEDLFVYLIKKSDLLKQLNKKSIREIEYLTHGKRGNIFLGDYKGRKIAVKVKRKESLAMERMKNEVKWLNILNKKKIGPKLLFFGDDYLVYEFVEGDFILDFVNKNKRNKKLIKKLIIGVLKQCFEMDKLGINKEEMHRPIKHIVVDKKGKVTLLDFERCYKTKKPHNVTQFGVFLMRNGFVDEKKMIGLLKNYKKGINKDNFDRILELTK